MDGTPDSFSDLVDYSTKTLGVHPSNTDAGITTNSANSFIGPNQYLIDTGSFTGNVGLVTSNVDNVIFDFAVPAQSVGVEMKDFIGGIMHGGLVFVNGVNMGSIPGGSFGGGASTTDWLHINSTAADITQVQISYGSLTNAQSTTIADVTWDSAIGEPGVGYCFGDGIAPHTMCPCGNNNDGSESGCDWQTPSGTAGGVLTATGSASISANDTMLIATNVSNDFGIFFGADNQVNGGNGNPLNDGLRCAGGGLVRLIPPTLASGNQAMTPSPVPGLDSGAAAGVTRRYQYWFRTPGGPCGQMANLTNGYEILWMP